MCAICRLFCKFWVFQSSYSGNAHHANYGKHSLNHDFRHGAHSVYKIYSVSNFSICCLFCTFGLFRNFYSVDANHANYGKHSLNHHFRHGAHSVYKIYSVLKLFDLLFVLRILIISDMAHTVYIRLTVF